MLDAHHHAPHAVCLPADAAHVSEKAPEASYRYPIQIIQLVECTAPPPRPTRDVDGDGYTSSSYASSSSASSSMGYDYSDVDDDVEESYGDAPEDDDGDEEVGSSYCSSDMSFVNAEEQRQAPSEPLQRQRQQEARHPSSTHLQGDADLHRRFDDDSYSLRMKRILAWRENFATHLSATLSEPALPSLKRKLGHGDDDAHDDSMSYSSKRSRSQASESSPLSSLLPHMASFPSFSSSSSSRDEDRHPDPAPYYPSSFPDRATTPLVLDLALSQHSCPACDASFPSRQSLRQHGWEAKSNNEACSVAVEYALE